MSLPRHSMFQTWLQASLVVGAAADALLALALVLLPRQTADLLGIPLPGEAFYGWLLALLLLLLSGFYLLAAYDPRAYVGNVMLAVLGRSAGAVVLFLAAGSAEHLAGLYPAAFAEFGFAVVHAVLFRLSRR